VYFMPSYTGGAIPSLEPVLYYDIFTEE
jgi:hypothetical protein